MNNKYKYRFAPVVLAYLHKIKIFLYRYANNKVQIEGTPILNQPTILCGEGQIVFEKNVSLGYFPSPGFYSGSIHIEARAASSKIFIGANTFINNNSCLIADKTSITIGANVLMGTNTEITDSDFHNLDPRKRLVDDYECCPVTIGDNVFIGSNVKILKGVTIGENSVIGGGSIVNKDIPANTVAAGIPAKVIKQL
jgi:acetyltransferase-like isoleucine patch superfamily enzyme